jgi:hypothetical protein
MTKELTEETLLEIRKQIGKIFLSNEVSITDCMSILIAIVMQCIRFRTLNDLNSNLEQAKIIYETMKESFEITK